MFRRKENARKELALSPRTLHYPGNRALARFGRWFLFGGLTVTLLGVAGVWFLEPYFQPAPGEIIRYARQRLAGHPTLERIALPILDAWRAQVERPVPGRLPSLGKGQQPGGLQRQLFGQNGQPMPAAVISGADDVLDPSPRYLIGSMRDIESAFQNARPGDVLEMLPGTYTMSTTIRTVQGGQQDNPITVTAKVPGAS